MKIQEGVNVSAFKSRKRIKRLFPKDFKEETTTVWNFKQRGNWATHSGEYRGNPEYYAFMKLCYRLLQNRQFTSY